MAVSLNDVSAWIKDIFYRLRRLESGAFLENSSISNGRMRFIGGTLLVDSGGQLIVVGSASVDGSMTVNGTFLLTGSGWRIVGSGSIEGPTTVVGTLQIDGDTRVTGNLSLEGDASLTGTLDVDGAGRILIGDNMRLDPSANGGSIKFAGGPEVYADGTTLALYSVGTGAYVEVGENELKVRGPGINGITVDAGGIKLDGARPELSTDGLAGWYGQHSDGYVVLISPGVGGPGGTLSWPFPPSTVTSEYGPREAPGEGASTFHEGIDFGVSEGTPIPAAGPGVVEFAGDGGGYGNVVVLNHGGGLKTRYAHMQTTPIVVVGDTVARGQILGPVGNTGISFGAHLHFEVEVDGAKVNPRSKLPAS